MATAPLQSPEPCALLLRESSRAAAPEALRTQEFVLRPEAQRRTYEVVRVYKDDGYSGELNPLDRPAVRECLADADQGLFTVVLMSDLDRAFRGEPQQYYALKLALGASGVRLEFKDGAPEDDGSEIGAMMHGLSLLLPSIKKRSIVKNLRAGRERALAEGRVWASVPPFGYVYVPGPKGKGYWEIRDDEAQWVRLIFERAAEGWTMGALARWLEKEGAQTRRGGKWWPTTIRVLLANPKYKGHFGQGRFVATKATDNHPYAPRPTSPQTGQEGRGRRQLKTSTRLRPRAEWGPQKTLPALALVDGATWERANRERERNVLANPRRMREPPLLFGLVFCTKHAQEHRMAYQHREDRPASWRCPQRDSPLAPYCKTYMRADRLERAVLQTVHEMASSPESLVGETLRAIEGFGAWRTRTLARQAHLDAQLAKLQTTLDNLALAHYGGDLERGQYERLRDITQAQYDAAMGAYKTLVEEVNQTQPEVPPLQQVLGMALRQNGGQWQPELLRPLIVQTFADMTREKLEHMTPDERRRRVRSVVEKVTLDDEGAWMVLMISGRRERLDEGTQRVNDGDRAHVNWAPFTLPIRLLLDAA